ncbi:beta-lactamase-like protein [Hyaloraphidium curvatum]|nr:beta-lactamase-like protein [Hyaloraphidium curvatum]
MAAPVAPKRPADGPPAADAADVLRITPLGAGNEVGRSCIVIEYKNKTIMLDCGIHPAYNGLDSLPFFDQIDPAKVDYLLVTHFHLDHAGAVPYFMQKTNFAGKVYMTHPTKAIYRWMLTDFLRISNNSAEDVLFDENDLLSSHSKVIAVDYHQTIELEGGIKFTAFNAGHVLGAAMFLIEIAGIRVLYTGDYSREEDRHLMPAERPPGTVEVMICESTFGVQSHEPRIEREARFTKTIQDIVMRKGRCLIPTFALGRAQELLLILDEYWAAHPELHQIPVYYASALAKKCMAVYQTYTNMMNARVKRQIAAGNNPFVFKHISNLKGRDAFDDSGPCVMMASPGMLQSGFSRELLESWAEDSRNGVMIAGYVVEGTLGKQILAEPEDIPTMNGGKLKRRCSVHYVTFAAHVDYAQNSHFIDDVRPPHLVLVHGDRNEMYRLKHALQSKYQERNEGDRMEIHTPENCKTVELFFRGEKMARTIGTLASEPPKDNVRLSGVLVARDFRYSLLAPEDLGEYTNLPTLTLSQKLLMKVGIGVTSSLVEWHLRSMFGMVERIEDDNALALDDNPEDALGMEDVDGAPEVRACWAVMETIVVRHSPLTGKIEVEWDGDPVTDILADAVVACIAQVEASRASVKLTRSDHGHGHGYSHGDGSLRADGPEEAKSTIVELPEDIAGPDAKNVSGQSQEAPVDWEALVDSLLRQHFGDSMVTREMHESADQVGEDAKKDLKAMEGRQSLMHRWVVRVDGLEVFIDAETMNVTCKSEEMRRRILPLLARARRTVKPLTELWQIQPRTKLEVKPYKGEALNGDPGFHDDVVVKEEPA